MELWIQGTPGDSEGIDLDDLWVHADDADELFELIVVEVAKFADERGIAFGSVTGLSFDDDDGEELAIGANENDTLWIHEVAKLYSYLQSRGLRAAGGAVLAYIEHVDWRYFDFDTDFRTVESRYYEEFDGDCAKYAAGRMEEGGNYISEDLESYFDFQAYGEALISDYDQCSWGDTTYLFSQ